MTLIRDVGFEPVGAGPLRIACSLEPFALAMTQLADEGDVPIASPGSQGGTAASRPAAAPRNAVRKLRMTPWLAKSGTSRRVSWGRTWVAATAATAVTAAVTATSRASRTSPECAMATGERSTGDPA